MIGDETIRPGRRGGGWDFVKVGIGFHQYDKDPCIFLLVVVGSFRQERLIR
jgi:hypothetical protein